MIRVLVGLGGLGMIAGGTYVLTQPGDQLLNGVLAVAAGTAWTGVTLWSGAWRTLRAW